MGGGKAPGQESPPRMPAQSSPPAVGDAKSWFMWPGHGAEVGSRIPGGKSQPRWEGLHSPGALGAETDPVCGEEAVFNLGLHKGDSDFDPVAPSLMVRVSATPDSGTPAEGGQSANG